MKLGKIEKIEITVSHRYEFNFISSAAPQHPFLLIFSLKKSNFIALELIGVGTKMK